MLDEFNYTSYTNYYYIGENTTSLKYTSHYEIEGADECSMEINGESKVCTVEEITASINEIDNNMKELEDYIFYRLSVMGDDVIFDEVTEIEQEVQDEIQFSTYTFGEEYPALRGKKLTFTMKSPKQMEDRAYGWVGDVDIGIDGVASYSMEMGLTDMFDVNVVDYNGDGNPEFAIDSNYLDNKYAEIFTVSTDGIISKCDINRGENRDKLIYLSGVPSFTVSPILTKSEGNGFSTLVFTSGGIMENEMIFLTDEDIDNWFKSHPDSGVSEFYLEDTYSWDGNGFVISGQIIFALQHLMTDKYK